MNNLPTTLLVAVACPYEVQVQAGILSCCGAAIAAVIPHCTVAIISDDTVDALYGEQVEQSLRQAGFGPCRIVFPHGERSKNLDTLSTVLEQLAAQELTRSDCIVALGGGVVGDLAGLAAALYLRGISYVQIPTSLLAMIDSSVGGKTAVDLMAGKNLAGVFWQPKLVLCDPLLLETLPQENRLDGLGEMIKYGLAFDQELLSLLVAGEWSEVSQWIARCIAIKAAVVAQDEHDHGERQKLNLGHTIGHAIERCSHFSISHGQAVATGCAIIAKACVQRGLLAAKDYAMLDAALARWQLSPCCSFSARELAEAALTDKKRRGDQITLVLPDRAGHTRLFPLAVSELENFFADGLKA